MSNIGANIWTTGSALEQPTLVTAESITEYGSQDTLMRAAPIAFIGDATAGIISGAFTPTLSAGETNQGGIDTVIPVSFVGGDAENGMNSTFPTFQLYAGYEAPPNIAGVQAVVTPRGISFGYTWNTGGIEGTKTTQSRIGNLEGAVVDAEFPPPRLSATMIDFSFTHAFLKLPTFYTANNITLVEDTFSVSDECSTETMVIIREAMAVAVDETTAGSTLNILGSDRLFAKAMLSVPHMLVFAESLDAAGVAEVTAYKMASVAEQAGLLDTLDSLATFQMSLAVTLALRETATSALNLTFAEAAELLAESPLTVKSAVAVSEAATAAAASSAQATFIADLSDTGNTAVELSTKGWLQALVEEGVSVYASIRVGADVYEGWVVNTKSSGFSQYTNFPFNSLLEADGQYYGVAEDGLYELTGNDDQGTDIAASIKTGLLDLGSHYIKDAKALHLGYSSGGKLVLKVTTTAKGQKEEWWYELKQNDSDSMRDGRFTIGRGLKAKYWQFELVNADGADFEVDDVQLMYSVLSRRIR